MPIATGIRPDRLAAALQYLQDMGNKRESVIDESGREYTIPAKGEAPAWYDKALADPEYYKTVGRGLLDAGNRGLVAQWAGGPVDLATMAMRPLGYDVEKPVGGSEWIGQKMQDAGMVSPNRNALAETAMGLLGPAAMYKSAAVMGPKLEGAVAQAVKNGMMPGGLNTGEFAGQRGAIAYHGSPHLIGPEGFQMSKIGTGEGMQAYGHGFYTSDSPELATGYGKRLGPSTAMDETAAIRDRLDQFQQAFEKRYKTGDVIPLEDVKFSPEKYPQRIVDAVKKIKNAEDSAYQTAAKGNLYKTDIPDEAVARFLDWDKPLSQQAPEVQAALQKAKYKPYANDVTGSQVLMDLAFEHGGEKEAAAFLRQQGIPGIRYLYGGSRGAGQGTSNFVSFDPEMIRILERNEVPTGAQPWKPGEYQGKLAELLSVGNKE